jgi:thiol:disulfide interchange protein DsbA
MATTLMRSGLLVFVMAVLAACGGQGEPQAPSETAAPAATEPAAGAPAAPAPAEQAPPPAPQTSGGVQESSDATVGSGGESLVLANSATQPSSSTESRYQAGQHYSVLASAQGTSSSPDKIEVAEIFWYGCPHCYEADPQVKNWAAKLPSDVSFVRIPVMWNPTTQIHARLFYTAKSLNKLDVMHDAIFREYHVNENRLDQEAEIQKVFERFGVSSADFQKTFRSFAVEGQLRRAKDLTMRYGVQGVPMMTVNGKFTITLGPPPGVKGFDEMLAVAGELVERERQRQ